MKEPRRVRALWNFSVNLHRGNCKGQRSIVLYENGVNTLNLTKCCFSVYFFAAFLFLVNPLYHLIIKRERTLIVNLYVPFVNLQSHRGYCLTMLYHLVASIYGFGGNMGYDLFMTAIVSNYEGIISILECQLHQINEINRLKDTPKNRNYRRVFLRNLYVQLLDVIE